MSADDPFEAIKQTFFLECEELLADLESHVTALTFGEGDDDTINAAFRAVHSVKGGAGAFGLDELVRFAHVFETFMDELRSGRKPCDEPAVRVMLHASDVLSDFVAKARGTIADMDMDRAATVTAELEALTHGGAAPIAAVSPESLPAPDAMVAVTAEAEAEPDAFGFTPVMFNLDAPLPDLSAPASGPGVWTIVFKPFPRLYETGNEPALLLRELTRLGTAEIQVDPTDMPDIAALDPAAAHLVWTVTLTTEADRSAITDVFEFVEGDCDVTITAQGGDASTTDTGDIDISALLAAATAPAPTQSPAQETPLTSDMDITALLAVATSPIDGGPADASRPAPVPDLAIPAPAIPASTTSGVTEAASNPARKPASGGNNAAPAVADQSSIREDLDRIDKLINVVGELVIQQAMLAQSVVECGMASSSAVSLGLEDLELLTREIQDSVMAIRAQPVKSVFQRMPRLVREVADLTGKSVRLVTEGEATEVDKTVVDRLAEPITHMIRNAIDHGLESPEGRAAAGKSAEGTIKLVALHRSGRIVIEVSDDGRGINRERVRQIAIDRGLIAADAQLSHEETDNLIFLPGFSTADAVSDISGRGVGMDVVRRSIQQLGGRISIASTPGQGSVFTMSLPLTLAVLDGMVVQAGGQTLLAPLTAVIESFTPKAGDVHRLGARDSIIRFRDRFVPLVDTAAILGFGTSIDPEGEALPESNQGIAIVVESEGGSQIALWVDAIQGQRQVVIKSLETNYRKVEGISAATILGDGRVALILDIDALVALGRQTSSNFDLKLAS